MTVGTVWFVGAGPGDPELITVKGRSLKRRIAHALGFEGGLGAILIPVMAWWFGISLWEATVMEAGMLAFFLVYTYGFNWAFDRIFGLPAAAQG